MSATKVTAKMTRVASSNIDSIGYSESLEELYIKFKSGKMFGYKNVSPDERMHLLAAGSIGGHFGKYIKALKEVFEVDLTEVLDHDTPEGQVEGFCLPVNQVNKCE